MINPNIIVSLIREMTQNNIETLNSGLYEVDNELYEIIVDLKKVHDIEKVNYKSVERIKCMKEPIEVTKAKYFFRHKKGDKIRGENKK